MVWDFDKVPCPRWSTVFATEERKRTSMSFEVWRCGLNYLTLLRRRPLNGRSGQQEGSRTAEQVRAGQACGGAYESLDKLGNDHRFLIDCARYRVASVARFGPSANTLMSEGARSNGLLAMLKSSFPARWNAALATSSHTFQLDNRILPCRLNVLRAVNEVESRILRFLLVLLAL